MSKPTQRDIFLCHASEDKTAIVNPIKDACRELGVSTWLDDDEIKWGESMDSWGHHLFFGGWLRTELEIFMLG